MFRTSKEEKKIRRPDQLVEMLFIQPFTRVKHLQEAKIYAEGTADAVAFLAARIASGTPAKIYNMIDVLSEGQMG